MLIIGSGRMGVRHAQGLLKSKNVKNLTIVDIKQEALDNAKANISNLANSASVRYVLLDDLSKEKFSTDICIIASTAEDRQSICQMAVHFGAKYLLIEKPLGQSYKETLDLVKYLKKLPLTTVVNLNMRLYEFIIRLKEDLITFPQMQGEKTITINTGSLGIGCNGIHYLDLLYFLFDADSTELISAEIDDNKIISGRGPQYCDFGGWAAIRFFKKGINLGKALISMSANSSVFGMWNIVGPHGQIIIDEIGQKRIDILRKVDSTMPINRYAADYLPPVESKIESPFLGDLTAQWVENISKGRNVLPMIEESLNVHKLMFDWLGRATPIREIFPIT